MKLSTLFLSSLAGTAIAYDGFLYTVDKIRRPGGSSSSSVSSDTATLIIARRRGLDDQVHLRTAEQDILNDINQFGGYQQPLFGADEDSEPGKLFIRINDFDGSISHLQPLPNVWIEKPTRNLLTDFKARNPPKDGVCEYDLSYSHFNKHANAVFSYKSKGEPCMSLSEIRTVPALLAVQSSLPTPQTIPTSMASFLRILSHVATSDNIETTLLILPSQSKLTKTIPRRAPDETPLEPPQSTITASSLPSEPTSSSPAGSNTTLPRYVPLCFSSLSSCQSGTNNCSGHGSCGLAHTSCYSCRCSSTVVRTNEDGSQKTVQWGGNACQKKDISFQFWLFVGVTVVMAGLVSGGIGMLWSMGSEELPSVIGAGVAGRSAREH